MVTDAIISWFQGLCAWFASTLPTSTPFDPAVNGADWSLFSTMDYYLPVHELLSVFVVVFGLGGPMVIVTLVCWVLFGVVRGGSPRA